MPHLSASARPLTPLSADRIHGGRYNGLAVPFGAADVKGMADYGLARARLEGF